MKTPEQIASELKVQWDDDHPNDNPDSWDVQNLMIAAIEADRAQRDEPVHQDWQDDADMYRDAAAVDITWRAWDASGRQIGYSDAGISGSQAAAMFEAIGRMEA